MLPFATNGFFVQYDDAWSLNSVSSTALFGTEYNKAEPNPWMKRFLMWRVRIDQWACYGLNGPRLVILRQVGCPVQLRTYGSEQLLTDKPFITGNRTDLEGRNEGLVAIDPHSPNLVILLAGTDANSLFRDRITGQQQEDPWGGTERHITVYDVETNMLEDRFFSNAKDGGNSFQYGRLAYPMNPFVAPIESGTLRVSRTTRLRKAAGISIFHSQAPPMTLWYSGLYLWNIQDLDEKGGTSG